MANIIRPIPGTANSGAWAALTLTAGDFNSCTSTGAALSSTVIAQSTNLDSFLAVSFQINASASPSTLAGPFLALYLLPKGNQGAPVYGDGYVSSKTVLPAQSYLVATANPTNATLTGNFTMNGYFPRVFIGDLVDDFMLAIGPGGPLAFNGTATASVWYRTINTNGNG
jgi:hypothetical protein